VLQHLKDYVATNAFFQDGVVCEWTWRGRDTPVTGLYVHPGTGLLRFAKRLEKRPEVPLLERVRVMIEAGELGLA
jgi:hypothetical protein